MKAVTDEGLIQIHCFAHVLNLCVLDVFSQSAETEKIKKKVSSSVTLVCQNSIARDELQAILQRLGVKKGLIKNVDTRSSA